MRYSQCRHGQSFPVEHRRCLCFSHISDRDIETNPSAQVALRCTQCGSKHLKCASLLIEESTEKCGKTWCDLIARWTDDGQWILANLITQPQKRGQVRDMIGMKMTDSEQR